MLLSVFQHPARGKWRFNADPSWHPTPGTPTIHATIKKPKRKSKTTRINLDSDENAYLDGAEKESGGHMDEDGNFIEDDI